jgi:hypothetical protein
MSWGFRGRNTYLGDYGNYVFLQFLFKGDICLKQEFFWILKIWYDAEAGESDTALLESW